jgi:hypothetical protein
MMRLPQEPMTIAQLKRYMDHRFDRLERTKANKSDLRRFATRRDLKRFATKSDLKRFATKRDLERFATKQNHEQFATKQNLEQFATKADAESLAVDTRRYFQVVAEGLEDKVAKIGEVGDLKSLLTLHSAVLDEHERRLTDLEHAPDLRT